MEHNYDVIIIGAGPNGLEAGAYLSMAGSKVLEKRYESGGGLVTEVKGGIKQGAYAPLQMGYNRPNHECSTTKTPVENFYLGGASCYPGGCVIWGPGTMLPTGWPKTWG